MTSSLKLVIMSLYTWITSLKDAVTSFTVVITSLQTPNYELETRKYVEKGKGKDTGHYNLTGIRLTALVIAYFWRH